jgi:hypothetical protein
MGNADSLCGGVHRTYRNGLLTLQNSGTNGNVWSSSRTAGSTTNARNLNFNGNNANTNSNLTGHRFPLRLVRASKGFIP